MDGTNLKAFPGRMQSLVIRMADATHHVQTWTHRAGEKDATMTFGMVRVK